MQRHTSSLALAPLASIYLATYAVRLAVHLPYTLRLLTVCELGLKKGKGKGRQFV